ncbi:MAG: class I SAM-dependent methyltransferase [Alphaproteobacteria bacterium]
MKFDTNLTYDTRENKSKYIWEKYQTILKGKILDVGADECVLKKHLPKDVEYTGIGLGGSVDIEINLEKEEIPFKKDEFDCVLCLETLEHLDNFHAVFDKLCSITNKYLVVSLPNPWQSFINCLNKGNYKGTTLPMKFYNLPIDKPIDRHKWFYGLHEAENFLVECGKRNSMKVVQIDRISPKGIRTFILRSFLSLVVHKDIKVKDLLDSTLWVVLCKEE